MKPSENKLRGGGNSPLTALKARCKREFERDGASATLEKILFWASETVGTKDGSAGSVRTNAEIRQLIGEFFKIQLERDSQLSSFYGWVRLETKTRKREAAIQHLLEEDRLAGVPEPKLDERGRRMFKELAILEEDSESWVKILRLEQQQEQLLLDREKFEFDAAKACLAKLPELKLVSEKKMSDDEKAKAIQQILFNHD